MSIESLKQQARRHEQKEEWQEALEHYKMAIRALADDDRSDIGLVNRVGDLCVRIGALDEAVGHYEKAVDLYREAFLPNNAIAVCKKIIRHVPGRHHAYLKIGQIRAQQGFLSDARANFLTYAERMQQSGNLDESFRALVEFCDLAPDDVQVRILVADQMVANHRQGEAVEQLLVAYRQLTDTGEGDLAAGLERRIRELDPEVELAVATPAVGFETSVEEFRYGDIELISPEPVEAPAPSAEEAGGEVDVEVTRHGQVDEESWSSEAGEGDEEEESVDLPMMSSEAGEGDEEEESVDLPMMSFEADEGDGEEEGVDLPMVSFEADEGDEEEEGVDLPMMSFEADEGDEDGDGAGVRPVDFDVAGELEDAVEEAAADAEPAVEPETGPEPPPSAPAAPAQEWVDLGAMILGGGAADKRTTRFKVAYEEPSGDEEADFAKMLSQFKEKVSENLDAGDVRAHHDLGTAYKEMGLLEEAISAFQQALRASSEHLPTYELMGQTFLEMGRPEAAVRTLQRALESKVIVEDEFLGIYYYLARALEALDRTEAALEYYDRVFSLDINFADVTERLKALR